MRQLNNICFLVNGNKNIGLGHIYRCIAIASEAFSRGINILFLIEKNEIVERLLNDNKISFEALSSDIWRNPNDNKSSLMGIFVKFDAIIIDLLENEFVKFRFISEIDKKIISITSFYYPEKLRYEDVSFFPGMKIIEKDIINNGKTKLFSGPKYLTFRNEFKRKFHNPVDDAKVPNILISMGGSDAFGFTLVAVKALLNVKIDFNATIILNSSATTYCEVVKLVSNKSNFSISSNVENISELMHFSTLAIINGGLTRYELALTGTPFIALSIHQTQFDITERLTSLVGGINLGVVKELSQNVITNSIEEIIINKEKRKAISTALKNIIDIEGSNRILNCIESL